MLIQKTYVAILNTSASFPLQSGAMYGTKGVNILEVILCSPVQYMELRELAYWKLKFTKIVVFVS